MPHVEELLEKLGTVEYFSILDLMKWYWQIPISAKSR